MAGQGVLTQREIDELLNSLGTDNSVETTELSTQQEKVKLYDFTRPNKLQHDELRGMDAIHNDLGKYIAMRLSDKLREPCLCELLCIDEQEFYDYTNSIINTSIIGIVDMSPLRGSMAIECSSTMVSCMISLILGGNPDIKRNISAYTEIELTLLKYILEMFKDPIINAWASVEEINPKVQRIEVSGQHVQIASPNETVAIATFRVEIGEHEGTMNCCIPYSMIEPIKDKINRRKKFRQQGVNEDTNHGIEEDTLVKQIDNVKIDIKCELGKSQLTMQEIECLQVGDVIKLSKRVGETVDILYNNVNKYTGEIGIKNNNYAVRIIDEVGRGEDLWQS